MKITALDLDQMPSRQRAALVNCLSGPKSVNLVGTRSAAGQSNLCIVSSCFHIGADPALQGLLFRPASVERHTFENILETEVFTLNQVHDGIYRQAHQTSARYPREVSEFAACGLTERSSEGFPAPYVAESRIALGMRLREHHPLAVNGTELIIGEICEIWLDIAPAADGSLDLAAAGSVAVTGLDTYHGLNRLARLSYAKPDRELEILD